MFLDLIHTTIVKMENTLDELKHFLENSKRQIIVKSVDCKEFVTAVLRQYEEEVSHKQITLTTHIDQPVPLYSDMARLRWFNKPFSIY
jgi:light-regulated signal transduction histidine kinase (bacteriophytochrome)